jgi:hypothetical protein
MRIDSLRKTVYKLCEEVMSVFFVEGYTATDEKKHNC